MGGPPTPLSRVGRPAPSPLIAAGPRWAPPSRSAPRARHRSPRSSHVHDAARRRLAVPPEPVPQDAGGFTTPAPAPGAYPAAAGRLPARGRPGAYPPRRHPPAGGYAPAAYPQQPVSAADEKTWSVLAHVGNLLSGSSRRW